MRQSMKIEGYLLPYTVTDSIPSPVLGLCAVRQQILNFYVPRAVVFLLCDYCESKDKFGTFKRTQHYCINPYIIYRYTTQAKKHDVKTSVEDIKMIYTNKTLERIIKQIFISYNVLKLLEVV